MVNKQDKNSYIASEITFNRIVEVVNKECKLSVDKILSYNRNAYSEYPRQIIMYLANTMLNFPYDEIAKNLIGKDKTGVKSGIQYITHILKTGTPKAANTKKILDRIKNNLLY